jgi:AraC family transcriptional regulator
MDDEQDQALLRTVLLQPERSGEQWAAAAFLSRAHFQRVFHRMLGEPPGQLQRRLTLERAAFMLRTTQNPVTVIALESGYQTHEGFTRAFKRAFLLSPRAYRSTARRLRELPGGSGVHFDPDTPSTLTRKGTLNMDLTDRLLHSDLLAKRRLLESARLLTDRQLDAPLAFRHTLMPWVEPARTLRESLTWMTYSSWVDVMLHRLGWEPTETAFRTVKGDSVGEMLTRFESYHAAFRAFVEHVRCENLWSKEWIDDTCDEPHTFSIGQVIEETLTCDIAYRSLLGRQLEAMGL